MTFLISVPIIFISTIFLKFIPNPQMSILKFLPFIAITLSFFIVFRKYLFAGHVYLILNIKYFKACTYSKNIFKKEKFKITLIVITTIMLPMFVLVLSLHIFKTTFIFYLIQSLISIFLIYVQIFLTVYLINFIENNDKEKNLKRNTYDDEATKNNTIEQTTIA